MRPLTAATLESARVRLGRCAEAMSHADRQGLKEAGRKAGIGGEQGLQVRPVHQVGFHVFFGDDRGAGTGVLEE